jgi:GntR family transcriptional regulator/MocR family aminotransferase
MAMPETWSTSSAAGVDLHLDLGLELPAGSRGGRRAALEQALRTAVRDGRLAPGSRLPSTRRLAAEVGVARGTAKAAYDQLVAEGYLDARQGSGTVVAERPAAAPAAPADPHRQPAEARYDLRPGRPDVGSFPVAAWLRATRRALTAAPAAAFDYGDPCGRTELRTALAEYLGRARGVAAEPSRIVVTSGYVQALALLVRVAAHTVAMEDPGLPFHREVVRRAGGRVLPLPTDAHGVVTDALLPGAPVRSRPDAVVVTPAHQYPTGVTLHPARRHALTGWAQATGGLVVEDDYDGEFRFDRQPVGALQGTAPDHVVYVGTAAKTLGPGLRLAWMVLPPHLVAPIAQEKLHTDVQTDSLAQLALAEMIRGHAYDRHVRAARLRYRRRRDLLVAGLERAFGSGGPYGLEGIAAGLHALLTLPPGELTEAHLRRRAARAGVAVGYLGRHWHDPAAVHRQGLVIGYGTPGEARYAQALDALLRILTRP